MQQAVERISAGVGGLGVGRRTEFRVPQPGRASKEFTDIATAELSGTIDTGRDGVDLPTTLADVEALIQNEVQESISLDYKASAAIDRSKRREIAKDVSAFANSAGGVLLYGVAEKDHLPQLIDGGVDHVTYSREWLEQVILTGISPRLGDLRIVQIPLSSAHSLYAVGVGQALRGPHILNGDGRYYKRFDFSSVPMEHFEIEDVRSRSSRATSLVSVDVAVEASFIAYLSVKNSGDAPAEDLSFEFQPPVSWEDGNPVPRIFSEGARRFPSGREMRFFYATFPDLAAGKEGRPSSLTVTVTYRHPHLGSEVREEYVIDFLDFLNSSGITPEAVRAAEKLEKVLKDIQTDTHRAVGQLEDIARGTQATGVALSVPTLRSLKAITEGAEIEKICAEHASHGIFREVLQVDLRTAHRLFQYFSKKPDEQPLDEVEGVTPEVIEGLRRHFYATKREI